MAGPFKMKGSPMQRNFGVGSPLHQDTYVPPGVTSNKGKSKFKKNSLENIITSASNAFDSFKSNKSKDNKSKDNKSKGNKNTYIPPGVINDSKNLAKKAKSLLSNLFQ